MTTLSRSVKRSQLCRQPGGKGGSAGSAVDSQATPNRFDAITQTLQAGVRAAFRVEAASVVGQLEGDPGVGGRDCHACFGRARVLEHIRQAFGDCEVGSSFYLLRVPSRT